MKKKLFLTTILTLFLLYGTILSTAQEKDYNTFSYKEWKDLSNESKLFYVAGYLQGSWAVVMDILYSNNSKEIKDFAESKLLPFYNHDLVVAVDWIYEDPSCREVSVYLILARLKYFMQKRYDLYKIKGE